MGMAQVHNFNPEDEIDVEEESFREKIIFYITDVVFGFFIFPFLHFILNTTVRIVDNPESLSEGIVILYVALLTGIYYILVRSIRLIIEVKIINIIFVFIGLIIFIVTLNILTGSVVEYFNFCLANLRQS